MRNAEVWSFRIYTPKDYLHTTEPFAKVPNFYKKLWR